MKDLIQANFLDVCERCNLEPEEALDICPGTAADLDDVDRDDLFFGIGYVRGIADAMDMTTLQMIEEMTA